MKKLLALLMITAMLMSLVACSAENTDNETSENPTASDVSEDTTAANGNDADATTDKADTPATTANANNNNNASSSNQTQKATTQQTTQATTTKRNISLTVKYPYSLIGQKVTITYKLKGEDDKKYKELVKEEKIEFDQKTYDFKDELIGDVDVHIVVSGPTPLMRNYFVVSGNTASEVIELVTSSEQLIGDSD